MPIKKDRYGVGTGMPALWIKGKKAEPFRTLLRKIAKELGTVREARAYIPLSGNTYSLVLNLEVTEGTGRRILDAHNKLFKSK